MQGICPGVSLVKDFGDPCFHAFWGAVLPAAFLVSVIFINVFGVIPTTLKRYTQRITKPLKQFVSLDDGAIGDQPVHDIQEDDRLPPIFSTQNYTLAFLGIIQTVYWLSVSVYTYSRRPVLTNIGVAFLIECLFMVLAWFYAAMRPMLRPSITPPFDLFSLYIIQLLGAALTVSGAIYSQALGGQERSLWMGGFAFYICVIITLLAVTLSMPISDSPRIARSCEDHPKVSPEDYCSLWKSLTFAWINPLIRRGLKGTLNEGDIWELSPLMQSSILFAKFAGMGRKSLLYRIISANSRDIILDFSLTYLSIALKYASPFFLKLILDIIANPTPQRKVQAYIYAALALVCHCIKAEADMQRLFYSRRSSVRARSELMASIYDKSLKRKDMSCSVGDNNTSVSTAKGKGAEKTVGAEDKKGPADTGKIVNMMSGDANTVGIAMSGMYFLYGAPLEVLIASTFLYQLLGWASLVGFAVLFLGWPINSQLSKLSFSLRKRAMQAKDKRMSVLNELVASIKPIKFFAWEEHWVERAMKTRADELMVILKSQLNRIMFVILWSLGPILVSIVAFTVYVLQENELTVGIAFTAIALFEMIRAPLNMAPQWLVGVLQTLVSIKRMESFLEEEEVSAKVSTIKRTDETYNVQVEPKVLGFRHATLRWNSSTQDTRTVPTDEEGTNPTDRNFELRDISVIFPDGQLTLVTGPTASGKTAFLLSILGEMELVEGELLMSKDPNTLDEFGLMCTISYAAQTAWLQHRTIRDNILFGSPFEPERYNAVVEACALNPDFAVIEDGDITEIGARGVSLSGGQKARVALARAVYARSKYVLLDDPFSAVDSHTARFIYENLLLGSLLEHRTVVLVTHHMDLLIPAAAYFIRMLDGRIELQGRVDDLRSEGTLQTLIKTVLADAPTVPQVAAGQSDDIELLVDSKENASQADKHKVPHQKLVKDEERAVGGVKWAVYNTYLKASTYWTWIILLSFLVLSQFLTVAEKLWIKVWGEAYRDSFAVPNHLEAWSSSPYKAEQMAMNGTCTSNERPWVPGLGTVPSPRERPLFFVAIFALIGVVTALLSVISSVTQFMGSLRASKILFQRLLNSVVRATMRWHDTTPAGRVLNRFSKDIETVDTSLADTLQQFNNSIVTLLGSIFVIMVIFPWFAVPATVIAALYYFWALGYVRTSRDLRRMEANARSPIFSGFSELLEGIVTVRAFSAERRMLNEIHANIDQMTRMHYFYWMANRWLLFRIEILCAFGVFIATLFSLSGLVGAGLAGVCITSAMTFTLNVYWACRNWTQLELDLNSVERVVEYLLLPQEPPYHTESPPPAHWPSTTNPDTVSAWLDVRNLTVKYAPDLPPVLKNVSFTLHAGERVGLLGRTGSGKSTLAMSILRFVETTEGSILIDGIDIKTIGIHDLRSRLTFIPQDAALFSGTIRDNIDPSGEYTDSECLEALRRVHLLSDDISGTTSGAGAAVPSSSHLTISPTGDPTATAQTPQPSNITLPTVVALGGSNFSQGQRQLIALARAVLRRSSVIILDEATSSIDFAADAKIQKTIREEFKLSLMFTVAHRLRTIIDYDRLLVLDDGAVSEFDAPYNLIQKEGGIFRTMCMKSGSFEELYEVAKMTARE